ncbi:hypothetical protein BX286_6966 [Streptomyces sp. 3211.6]|nr:hypothetical protein BX286_6966 [Streptomyces sp. 3211.6]
MGSRGGVEGPGVGGRGVRGPGCEGAGPDGGRPGRTRAERKATNWLCPPGPDASPGAGGARTRRGSALHGRTPGPVRRRARRPPGPAGPGGAPAGGGPEAAGGGRRRVRAWQARPRSGNAPAPRPSPTVPPAGRPPPPGPRAVQPSGAGSGNVGPGARAPAPRTISSSHPARPAARGPEPGAGGSLGPGPPGCAARDTRGGRNGGCVRELGLRQRVNGAPWASPVGGAVPGRAGRSPDGRQGVWVVTRSTTSCGRPSRRSASGEVPPTTAAADAAASA